MQNPATAHKQAAIRVLRHLTGNPSQGILMAHLQLYKFKKFKPIVTVIGQAAQSQEDQLLVFVVCLAIPQSPGN